MTKEEAIEIVRNIYQTDAEKEALAVLIPELAESDDERIREWIVKFIDEQYPEAWKDKKDKMLAYLKKQKEQKPVEPCECNDDAINKQLLIWFEKGKCSGRDEILQQISTELSEEDRKKIERLRSIVNKCASYNHALDVNGDYCEGDYAELDEWLKSLPVNLKNRDVSKLYSNKWSEEDDYALNKVIEWAKIVNPTSSIFKKMPKEQFIKRLQSLRPF